MPAPMLVTDEVVSEVNQLLADTRYYRSPDDLQLRRVQKKAMFLIKQGAFADGYSTLASVAQISGDEEAMRHNIDNGIRLQDSALLRFNKSAMLGNLGYFSEAQDAFRAVTEPTNWWSRQCQTGLNCLAFESLERLINQAQALKLEDSCAAHVSAVAAFLRAENTTEIEIARRLDVAGSIIRDQKLLFMGNIFADLLTVEEESRVLEIIVLLPVDVETCEELDTELARRTAQQFDRLNTNISVEFRSGLGENERYLPRHSQSSPRPSALR